jgi:uncharacterized protein YbaP (TraB family)
MRRWLAPLLAVFLSACSAEPQPARPALWQVEGPDGQTAWLFGTIHSLPRPADWRSPEVDNALTRSDRIVVEVGNLADGAAMAAIFARLARTPGQPPLSQKVRADLKGELASLMARGKIDQSSFDDLETWAAALTLARIGEDGRDSSNGIDRAVITAAGSKPVVELEGAAGQLGIFDALPEREQRDLLNAVVGDQASAEDESANLAETWRKGDIKAIEADTRTGLLADPELREALFVARNRIWTKRITAMMGRGEQPFVAVGAAHMAGPEGLPAMLAARGYKVNRVQ